MKIENSIDTIRETSSRMLDAINLVPYLPSPPILNVECNGDGDLYRTMRYWVPENGPGRPGKQYSVYLGKPDDASLQLLRDQINTRWPGSHMPNALTQYDSMITEFNTQLDKRFASIKKNGEACGYYLHGYTLRRMRRIEIDPNHQKPPADMEQTLKIIGGDSTTYWLAKIEFDIEEALKITIQLVHLYQCRLLERGMQRAERRRSLLVLLKARHKGNLPTLRRLENMRLGLEAALEMVHSDRMARRSRHGTQ